MKSNRILTFFACGLVCAALLLNGCGKKAESESVSPDSPSGKAAVSVTDDSPLNNLPTTDQKITQTPEEAQELLDIVNQEIDPQGTPSAADSILSSGDGIAYNLPESVDCQEAKPGDVCTFTRDSGDWYTVTVTDIALTDREVFAAPDNSKILLVSYSYSTLTEDPVLVDDMSFRCETEDGSSVSTCALNEQKMGDLATPDADATAEIAYAIPADSKTATIYLTNNAMPEGNTFMFKWTEN